MFTRALLLVALVTTWAAPARAQAMGQDAAGLLADVERIVSVEQSLGWFVDRTAYEEVLPAMLQSVCRTSPAARIEARTELARRSRELGSARQLFVFAGRRLDGKTKEALFVERQLGALEHAMARADADCPFFVQPEPDFIGRQTDRNRFTLSLETGGMIQIRRTEGDWTFGGGGTGRILPGYGFGGAITVLAGAEFGGGAMIRPGAVPTQLAINYFPAIPVVVRFHDVSWHYDLELARLRCSRPTIRTSAMASAWAAPSAWPRCEPGASCPGRGWPWRGNVTSRAGVAPQRCSCAAGCASG